MKITERMVQNQIIEYLRSVDIYCWENHTKGTYDPVRKSFRRMGAYHIKGVSDILGVTTDGQFVAIEVKKPELKDSKGTYIQRKGYASAEQKAFLKAIREQGGIAFIARSIDDCIPHLKTAGVLGVIEGDDKVH